MSRDTRHILSAALAIWLLIVLGTAVLRFLLVGLQMPVAYVMSIPILGFAIYRRRFLHKSLRTYCLVATLVAALNALMRLLVFIPHYASLGVNASFLWIVLTFASTLVVATLGLGVAWIIGKAKAIRVT